MLTVGNESRHSQVAATTALTVAARKLPWDIRMKALVRSYFWWAGLDQAIQELGKSCDA